MCIFQALLHPASPFAQKTRNPGFRNSSELQEKSLWEEVWNQRLAKALLGADSKNLKMRRLPPAGSSQVKNLPKD